MRFLSRTAPLLLAAMLAGCESQGLLCCGPPPGNPSLRVVNGFTTPVSVLIDGQVAIQSMAAGTIGTAVTTPGQHTMVLQPTGAASLSQTITTTSGSLNTFAVVRTSSGALDSKALDDTNSVVPSGKTKVRVLHLAPNAGTLQVYRTQPDFQTPVSWQFPFTYQADPTPLSAPFYQSTVGTWEIHVWQTPADASGWANAPVKVTIPLASGEKKTVVILDKPGGGVRVELL